MGEKCAIRCQWKVLLNARHHFRENCETSKSVHNKIIASTEKPPSTLVMNVTSSCREEGTERSVWKITHTVPTKNIKNHVPDDEKHHKMCSYSWDQSSLLFHP